MRIYRTPIWLHRFFRDYTWKIPTKEKVIYLSFDDGPDPEVTPFVLEQLKTYNAKACFFCVGDNLLKHPQIASRVRQEGHVIGNHTQHHIKGWFTPFEGYILDIQQCQENIGLPTEKTMFRPPYGRITRKQGKWVLQQGYRCVMWDILSYDYDKTLHVKDALKRIVSLSRKGSIIVFHDSKKAQAQLEFLLPAYLEAMHQKGYRFDTIPIQSNLKK